MELKRKDCKIVISGDNSIRFRDKVAIVTGGGSGLGIAIAMHFAKEGANLAIVDVNEVNMKKVLNKREFSTKKHMTIQCDVSQSDLVRKMVEDVVKEYGKIDIVVNNAGINISHPLVEFPVEAWDKVLDVNLKSMFLVCKYTAPHMIKARQGKIINMSSKSGGRDGSLNAVAYTASKAGVIGLTKTVALELAPYNINVNAVCPGFIYTPMWEKSAVQYAAKSDISVDELQEFYISKIPLRRAQTEESIAKVVLFLASEDSIDITGQALFVTGGQ